MYRLVNPLVACQAYEKSTGKVSSANKEAFRATLVRQHVTCSSSRKY
jgi:hypothetical protein